MLFFWSISKAPGQGSIYIMMHLNSYVNGTNKLYLGVYIISTYIHVQLDPSTLPRNTSLDLLRQTTCKVTYSTGFAGSWKLQIYLSEHPFVFLGFLACVYVHMAARIYPKIQSI